VLFSRVLVPQLSQTKTSFFMRHHSPVRKSRAVVGQPRPRV
jgi:hypothetical protein